MCWLLYSLLSILFDQAFHPVGNVLVRHVMRGQKAFALAASSEKSIRPFTLQFFGINSTYEERVNLCFPEAILPFLETCCHWYNDMSSLLLNPLTAKLFNLNFTHLKLCLADAIHNFKWVKIIQIWQNRVQLFLNIAVWFHILSLTCLKGGT